MGVWAQITADEQAGLVYLPVEAPTQDIYGGNRPGANLFGETLVAVDLKTGRRKWYFQFTHHPIWDLDIPAAPILADIVVDGKADQGRRSADEAERALRVRSHHRGTGVAHRREAGAAEHRAW